MCSSDLLGTLGLPESSLQAAKARVMVMAKVERLSKVIVMSKKSFGACTENVKRHRTSDVPTLWYSSVNGWVACCIDGSNGRALMTSSIIAFVGCSPTIQWPTNVLFICVLFLCTIRSDNPSSRSVTHVFRLCCKAWSSCSSYLFAY